MCHHSQVNDPLRDISSVCFCVMLSFFSHNMEERMEHIRLVLQEVKNKIIHESRKMWVSSVSFIIEQGQVKSDPANVQDYSRISPLPPPRFSPGPLRPSQHSACLFCLLSVSVLPHLDPFCQFIAEVDTSESGVAPVSLNRALGIKMTPLSPTFPMTLWQSTITT